MANKTRNILLIIGVCFLLMISILIIIKNSNNKNNQSEELANSLFHDGLVPIKLNDKWGYLKKDGTIAIDFMFERAFPFSNGIAIVENDEGYGLIDQNGEYLLNQTYDFLAIDEKTKLLWYKKAGKIGLITIDNRILSEPIFDDFSFFSEERAMIIKDDKYGFINEEGEIVIDATYDYASSFHDGMAVIKIDNHYGYINKAGEIIISTIYHEAYGFDHGFAVVGIKESDNLMFQVINKTGDIILEDSDTITRTPSCFICLRNKRYYLFNHLGNQIGDVSYKHGEGVRSDLDYMVVQDDINEINIIDKNGNVILDKISEEEEWLYDDVTKKFYHIKELEDQFEIKDESGSISQLKGDYLVEIIHNRIIVEKNSKLGVLAISGEEILAFLYDQIIGFNDGYFVVKLDDKVGVIDINGKEILSIIYQDINY